MFAERPEVSAWKAAYRELDSSALLSLLPALDAAIAAAKPELGWLERVQQEDGQHQEFFAKHLQNAMMLREQGVDVTEYVAKTKELADLTAEQTPRRTEAMKALFAYLVDLTTRRRWILDVEARRRGLLPNLADFSHPAPPTS